MEYEVEITIKSTQHGGRTKMRGLRQVLEFGDNPKWFLAGEIYALDATAFDVKKLIEAEMDISDEENLSPMYSGTPIRRLG